MDAYEKAEKASDPVRRYYLYDRASGLVTPDMQNALNFAEALAPSHSGELKPIREALASLSGNIETAKAAIAIYIKCDDDPDGIITAAVSEAFSSHGFKTVESEGLSSNLCGLSIKPNKQTLEAGTFYAPSLALTLYGSGGAIFSWNTSVDREGAFNPVIAKRRAWTDMADKIAQGLWKDFDEKMRK
jgi:hypothetical protein